ncbi:MAG: phospholipase D-like domain-containing protein [Lacunisphaera sp.]
MAETLASATSAIPAVATGRPCWGNGYDALLLRIHLIRQARTSIEIQTFIWTNDEVGRLLMYELIEAAKRGVKVRIIADQMVSDQDPATVAWLATVHPNLEIKHYRPPLSRLQPTRAQMVVAGITSFSDVNQRMHKGDDPRRRAAHHRRAQHREHLLRPFAGPEFPRSRRAGGRAGGAPRGRVVRGILEIPPGRREPRLGGRGGGHGAWRFPALRATQRL